MTNRASNRASNHPFARPIGSISMGLSIGLVSASISLIGIAGCSRSDDAQQAVKEAGRSFDSIAGGDATASPSFSETTYSKTEDLLKQYAGNQDGYHEAAAVSLSLSKLGQASLSSMRASDMETEALQQARVIRGMINEWLTMSAIAKAAGQFDPSSEISEIEHIISLRQEDIRQYTAQREQIQSEIDKQDAQIADLRSKSTDEREQAGGLELQMPRVSAVEAAQIAQHVREYTLRADQYELEAVRIEGVVGQLRPGAREIGLNVNKATSQIALLQDALNELHDREVSSQNDAQQAQSAAQAAAKRITEAVANYAQLRAQQVNDANEQAISLARASISALRDATRVTKQIGSLTKASARQTLAELYARQAGGFAEAAILYHALDEAGIPGDWASPIQDALSAQQQAKAAANEGFQNAASSLRGARIQGPEGEKLEATAIRLDQLGGIEPKPEFDKSADTGSADTNTVEPIDETPATPNPTDDGG